MPGGWKSNSGGTCPKAGVMSGVLFVIIEKEEILFVVLMMYKLRYLVKVPDSQLDQFVDCQLER